MKKEFWCMSGTPMLFNFNNMELHKSNENKRLETIKECHICKGNLEFVSFCSRGHFRWPYYIDDVIYTTGEDGWIVAECKSMKGCVSQGKTKEEAERNIKEVIELCLEVILDR